MEFPNTLPRRLKDDLDEFRPKINTLLPQTLAQTKLCEMIQALRKCVSSDENKPWPLQYWDNHPSLVMMKVDSHQLNSDGSMADRYNATTPNTCIAHINQVADNAASFMLGSLSGIPANCPNIPPPDCAEAPPSLRFEIMIGESVCDKDTSQSIWRAINQDMVRRAQFKTKQGAAFRALQYCANSLKLLPNAGHSKRLFHGIANSHTRSCYKDPPFRLRVWHYFHNAAELLPPSEQRLDIEEADTCPNCVSHNDFSTCTDRPRGTSEHLHLHCTSEPIRSRRNAILLLLENACQDYIRHLRQVLGDVSCLARLLSLCESNKTLEIESSQAMRALCGHRKTEHPPRTTNISYTTTPYELRILLAEVDINNDMDDLIDDKGFVRTPWASALGLSPGTVTSNMLPLANASALDFTYIGHLP